MTDPQTAGGQTGVDIRLSDLNRTFDSPDGGTFTALQDVNFHMRSGEFVAIVGPSGCGKTTLLRIVMGLEVPTSGAVGFEPATPQPRRGFVFQRPSLLPWRTVSENIEFGLEVRAGRGLYKGAAARSEHLEFLLGLTGLEQFRNYYPSQISGGMQQRANLARALAVDPNVLLMDEPFSALDAMSKERLQRELAGIVAQLQATVVFVTHDIREAVFLADRIIVMSAEPGRISNVVDVVAPEVRSRDYQHSIELAEQAREIWDLLGTTNPPADH